MFGSSYVDPVANMMILWHAGAVCQSLCLNRVDVQVLHRALSEYRRVGAACRCAVTHGAKVERMKRVRAAELACS